MTPARGRMTPPGSLLIVALAASGLGTGLGCTLSESLNSSASSTAAGTADSGDDFGADSPTGSGSDAGSGDDGGADGSILDAALGEAAALDAFDAADDSARSDAANGDAATDGSTPVDAGSPLDAMPLVSFTNDVMPIFARTCTLTSECHGQVGNQGEQNLYLGNDIDPSTATIIAQVYAGLVGVPAEQDPQLSLVKAGDHADSYLYVKLGDSQDELNTMPACANGTCSATSCTTSTPCGTTMPYGNAQLSADELLTIATWIDQGALEH